MSGRDELRVTNVEVIPVSVPRTGTFMLQRGASAVDSPFTVVRLSTDQGVVGYGECTTRTARLYTVLEDHLTDVVVGADPFDMAGLHGRLDMVETLITERREHWNPIRAALDMAMYDIQGKWLGVPLHRLLGGKQRESVETVKNIGIGPPEQAAEAAVALVEHGYTTLKMRVGADARLDLARLAAVREAVPDHVRIRVDANEAWDAGAAVVQIGAMAAYGLESVEQPCRHWDLRGSARVMRQTSVPVMLDEAVWTLGDLTNAFVFEAADAAHLYLGKNGGIFPVMRMCAIADGFGKAVSIGERVPLGISEAAHVHVAAALGREGYPSALSYQLHEHDLLTEPLRWEGSRVFVPDGPGLGVVVDEERLDHYRR
jgi:L-alanine-DL-glutamate epimerase-like enolase superfamily enzyme